MSDEKKTTEDHLIEFIKAFHENEEAIQPFLEHRRDLKKNYAENGWLSKEEVGFAVKVYRMMKQDIDFDHFTSVYENISKGVGGSV